MNEHPVDHGRPDTAAGAGALPADDPLTAPIWHVVVLGIATTLFGLVVLIWPRETLHTLGILVGIWLMVVGAARILNTFVTKRYNRPVLSGTVGVLLLVGGVACLRNVANGVLVLALVIALAWLLSGVAEFVVALQTSGPTRTWLLALAVLSVAIGLAFTFWPGLSLATIVLLTGISALVIGVAEIAFAIRMRSIVAAP
jgi:uncharacterized membrane protein HdeD (DUF308 family)